MSKTPQPAGYASLLKEIKSRIVQAQTRAVLSANAELIRLYWDLGRLIGERQRAEGWGAAVIPRLARELQNELPEEKGFSERNIKRMLAFFRAYPDPTAFVPQAVAPLPVTEKVPQVVAQTGFAHDSILWLIPWGHHALLMEKVEIEHRLWYMQQTLANGWSRNVLLVMIQSDAHRRAGRALTNFDRLLPAPQSDLVRQTLKDPYIFDVRHDNREGIADTVSRTLGRRCLSRPTYLKSKDNREHSLLVKRQVTTKCPDHAPQGLRSTVKATLLELQFHRTSGSPVGRAFDDDADRSSRSNRTRPDPPAVGVTGDEPAYRTNGAPTLRSDVPSRRSMGWPTGREPHGHGVPVVVRAGESPVHGEGGQVTRCLRSQGARDA
jgi:predicted nuclease of restriction endonuclease-like (RecB) superfamily